MTRRFDLQRGQTADVPEVVVFLVSECARWITRASVPVDGGSRL